jgi:YD repeat-containing protein
VLRGRYPGRGPGPIRRHDRLPQYRHLEIGQLQLVDVFAKAYEQDPHAVLGRAETGAKLGCRDQPAHLALSALGDAGLAAGVRRARRAALDLLLADQPAYGYDAIGDLTVATDPLGYTTTNTYDVRRYRTTGNDPDLGQRAYTYDVLGELIAQTGAKSQTTVFSYDKLGRLVQLVEPDITSVWNYDSASHGIGKLASATIIAGQGAGYQRIYSYDAQSRPVQVATTIDDTSYTNARRPVRPQTRRRPVANTSSRCSDSA